jgi:hypothetical protein
MSELTQMEYSTATGCTFVILSDERKRGPQQAPGLCLLGCWSEESKDPYGRKQSPICQCAERPH